MSEEKDAKPELKKPRPMLGYEPMLMAMQYVVGMGKDNAVPITLAVRGLIITGTLVSIETFAKAEEAELQDRVRGNGREMFLEIMKVANEQIAKSNEPDVASTRVVMSRDVLHLVRARVLSGARSLPRGGEDGVCWRVRLSEVDGWAFGEANPALVAPLPGFGDD